MADAKGGGHRRQPNVPGHTMLGGPENVKLLFDSALELVQQIVSDGQEDARAWRELNLQNARAHGAFIHAVNMGSLLSAQAGVTEAQQTVSPIRTGAGDVQAQQPAGAAYPPIRNVDQTGATATGGVQAALQAIADAVANLQNMLVAQVGK